MGFVRVGKSVYVELGESGLMVLHGVKILSGLVLIGAGACLAAYRPDPAFELRGDAAKGKAPYARFCQSCHGERGDGKGPTGRLLNPRPADYTDPERMKGMSDHYLYSVVREGAAVMGKSPLMAPWKAVLKDQEIRDVVAYIRTLEKAGE